MPHLSTSLKKIVPNAIKRGLKPHLLRFVRPRRFHAYCVGTPKSGTVSVSKMFEASYYAEHEPELEKAIDMIVDTDAGRISPAEMSRYVRQRVKYLWLELDSSSVNYFFIKHLIKFPEAKFILTIRDCYSWLNSKWNQILNRHNPDNPWLRKFDKLRFASAVPTHDKQEAVLAKHGLYRLEGYICYWAKHNQGVLQAVPRNRLLVIRTHELSARMGEIADFLAIPASTLNGNASHSNKALKDHKLLSQIDQDYLEGTVQRHAKTLMDEFFPDYGYKHKAYGNSGCARLD